MKKLLLLSLFSVSSISWAGDTVGKINEIYMHNVNDVALFNFENISGNFQSCATTKRYAFDASTARGKAILSMVLSAKAANLSVHVHGSNKCDVWDDSESIEWLMVKQ